MKTYVFKEDDIYGNSGNWNDRIGRSAGIQRFERVRGFGPFRFREIYNLFNGNKYDSLRRI